MCKITLDKT